MKPHSLVEIRVKLKINFSLLKFIYFHFKTPIKQIFLDNATEDLIWQKLRIKSEKSTLLTNFLQLTKKRESSNNRAEKAFFIIIV